MSDSERRIRPQKELRTIGVRRGNSKDETYEEHFYIKKN